MATREELLKRKALLERKLQLEADLISEQQNQSNAQAGQVEAQQQLAGEIGPFESLAIATGRGLTDIGRAVTLADDEPPIVQQSFAELEEQRPVSQVVGRAVGQSLPFLPAGVAAGGLASLPGRIAASTVIGGVEGGTIAAGTGQEITESAGLGGAIGGAAEAIFPILSRIGGALVRRVTGNSPKGSLFTPEGSPTPELQSALNESGVTIEDLSKQADELLKGQPVGADPTQAARAARFSDQGIPATKGDITQDFTQQAQEARLVESTADVLGDPVRSLRLRQSEGLVRNLDEIIPKLGVSDNLGNQIKAALTGRKKLLRKQKNKLYQAAAKNADQLDELPIFSDVITDAIPDSRLFSRIGRLQGNQSQALKGLLAEFGLDTTNDAVELLAKQGVEPQTLTLKNFDEFRVALGQIERADQTGATSVLVGPIRDALDGEADNLAKILQNQGVTDSNILDPLIKARKTVRQLKTEFSPQSITGRLIGSKKDGVTPIIEASSVFKEIVGTNKPIELLQRTVKSLKSSGKKGTAAMGDLQAATVTDLIDSGFKSQGRKIQGTPLFNVTAFNNRLAQIGDEKLKLIFQNNPEGFRRLKQISKTARDIRPSDSAIPKGSGSVILDALNKVGILKLSSSIPGLGLFAEGLQTLAEKGGQRKVLSRTLDAAPDITKQVQFIRDLTPSIAVALGISEDEQ